MNKKLLALALCASLNVSVWASESDDELAIFNSDENKATISKYNNSSNFHANKAASREQSTIIPGKFSSFEVKKIEANKKSHKEREQFAPIDNNGQRMDTSRQNNRGRRKSKHQENNNPELEKISEQKKILTFVIEEQPMDTNNTQDKITASVIAVRPKSRSNSSLSDRERRSASRLDFYNAHRNYDDSSDNDENSQAIKRK